MLRSRRATWLVFAAALALLGLQLRLGIDLQDEGLLCDYASRLLHGQRPYVDFEPPYEAGRYLALAGLFRLFGESILVERAAFVLMLALAAALTHRLALRLLPPALAFLPPLLLVLVPGPLWKLELHLALAAAVWAALVYGEAPSSRRAWLAGALLGVLAWDRPDLPVIAAALLCCARAVSPACRGRPLWPDVLRCAGSALLVFSPLLALLALREGALRGALEAHLWMTRLHEHAPPFVLPWRSPHGLVNGLFFFAGPLLALLALPVLARKRDLLLSLLSLSALLMWNQVRVRPNLSHAMQAAWPVWLLGPALAVRLPRWPRVLALLITPLFAWQAALTMPAYPGLAAVWSGRAQRTGWPRADVWLPPRLVSGFGDAADYLRGRGGHALVVSYAPMISFISGVPSPAFLDNLLPGRLGPADEERLIRELDESRTDTVVRLDTPGDPPFDQIAPRLWQHIAERFHEVEPRGVFRAFERGAAAPSPR